ncbi:MAG: ABC transporter substrate-binding protein [Chloroflexota bacterium]
MTWRHSRSGVALAASGALLASMALAVAPVGAQSPSAGALPACDATQIGPLTRCENFYTDFWPIIDQNLDALHQEALATAGGQVILWGWFETDPATIEAFTTRFPGLTIKTQGLQYNLGPSVLAAQATGAETTDILGGTWTTGRAVYDQGFHKQIDWSTYGVPPEFQPPDSPWFPRSMNGWLISYNTTKVDSVPTKLTDYLDPKWKGEIAMDPTFASFFAPYGLNHGEDAMVKLMHDLRDSGNLILTKDPFALLGTGDVSVVFDAQNFSTNPDIAVAAFEDSGIWTDFAGVNKYGANQAGGALWDLWNAFDPDWLAMRTTDDRFATSWVPYPGLPDSTFAGMSDLKKMNLAAWLEELEKGWAVFETADNGDAIMAMEDAARAAFE